MELDLYAYDAPDGVRWSLVPVQQRAEDPAAKIEGDPEPGLGDPRHVARIEAPEGTRVADADPATLVVGGGDRVQIAAILEGRATAPGLRIIPSGGPQRR